MHTLLVILAGFLLGGAVALLGYLWGGPPWTVTGAYLFIPAWLVLSGVNAWIGVARAGYKAVNELPIMVLVAAVPAVAVLAAARIIVG